MFLKFTKKKLSKLNYPQNDIKKPRISMFLLLRFISYQNDWHGEMAADIGCVVTKINI